MLRIKARRQMSYRVIRCLSETMHKLGLNQQRGLKLNRSEVNNSEREQRYGREQLSLRKAAYIPTGLRRKATDATATISCVCY